MSLNTTTIAAKVPTVSSCSPRGPRTQRRLTPSLLIRTLVEAELSAEGAELRSDRGDHESASR